MADTFFLKKIKFRIKKNTGGGGGGRFGRFFTGT